MKQLFPVNAGGGVVVEAAASSRRQWLDLSVRAGNSAPVKKSSRRGPRSRSSQYRGVTFYRRTGRWESHIWYIIQLIIMLPVILIVIALHITGVCGM